MYKITTLLVTILVSSISYAVVSKPPVASEPVPAPVTAEAKENKPAPAKPAVNEEGHQKIIDEYKAYLTTVDKDIRSEIVSFRKEIAKLNKQKHLAYRGLSQEAQHYLAKERELKRKLPKDQRKVLDDSDTEE